MDRLYDIYNAHGMYSLKDTRKHYHGEPEYERDYVNVPLEPPVEPEVLVEKMNVSEKTKTPPGKAGWNILLSLRYLCVRGLGYTNDCLFYLFQPVCVCK